MHSGHTHVSAWWHVTIHCVFTSRSCQLGSSSKSSLGRVLMAMCSAIHLLLWRQQEHNLWLSVSQFRHTLRFSHSPLVAKAASHPKGICIKIGARDVAQWYSACLACVRGWLWSSAQQRNKIKRKESNTTQGEVSIRALVSVGMYCGWVLLGGAPCGFHDMVSQPLAKDTAKTAELRHMDTYTSVHVQNNYSKKGTLTVT